MNNSDQIIRLTKITANHFPVDPDYYYRCIVEFRKDNGQVVLQKKLLARQQPYWLLSLTTKGDCQVKIAFLYRQGNLNQPWQELGKVSFFSQNVLKGKLTQDLELKVDDCKIAPDLSLKVRLTKLENYENKRGLNIIRPQRHELRLDISENEALSPDLATLKPITLTPQEEVMVKDVWNKLRPFKEFCLEMFVKRLLWQETDLEYYFGDFLDGIGDRFYELFELGIRQLQPQTENILRESLIGIPTEKNLEWQTFADYCDLFAGLGMNLSHWLTARKVWLWMLLRIPYLEDYERENLAKARESAFYRFFTTYILIPMGEAIEKYQEALNPKIIQKMYQSWQVFSANKRQMGIEFYQTLFTNYPEILPLFGRADMNYLSLHLFQALEFLVSCLEKGDTENLLQELRLLGLLHSGAGVPPNAYPPLADTMFILFERYVPNFTPELKQAWLTLFNRVANIMRQPKVNEEKLLTKAKEFLDLISSEQEWETDDYTRRWQEIETEIKATGSYTHTYEELAYGACVAWRNASKCIGRIQWNNLIVRDRRDLSDPDDIFEELKDHLQMATNGGNIQLVMTVFRPRMPKEKWGPRIWNPQLICYAAYKQDDGTILGDPANLELTQKIKQLGWQPPANPTQFDILPLVIEVPGYKPKIYEFPPEDILEVEIKHPTIPEFNELGLRWYVVPAISNFRLDIGGISYCCAPFNGWYMETEIARDFLDPGRYHKIEEIAHKLELDSSNEQNLWRDRVFLELNLAIVHSFNQAKVTIVDHQTAAQQFLTHDLREKKAGRECPANWGWIVPPAGGSTCPVYHHEMRDFYLDPHYHHGANKWQVEDTLNLDKAFLEVTSDRQSQERILILYASETGTAENFARQAARKLRAYSPEVMALDEYDTQQIASEKLMLIITSTFGKGEIPGNGKNFLQWLKLQPKGSLKSLNYSVMAIGSTVYQKFCAAGVSLDKGLTKAGANCIVPIHKGDQIKGQAQTFNQWLDLVTRVLSKESISTTTSKIYNDFQLHIKYLKSVPVEPMATVDYNRGVEVRVIKNEELLQEVIEGSRSTRHLVFDLNNTNLDYQTGDHLAVYPHNPRELVNSLGERLGVNLDAYFTATYVDNQGQEISSEKLPFPTPITIRQLLTEELDLFIQEPFEDLLAYLYSVTSNQDEQRTLATWLEFLSQGDNTVVCLIQKKHITDNYFTLVDLLNEFPSAQVELSKLLELLPKQKPRLYSISSSAEVYPHQIHLTVGTLQITKNTGKTRQGLCSNYLAGLTEGEKVRVSVHKSNFRPPPDPEAIMLMVGTGTGISPLIGFLQHRESLLEKSNNKIQKTWQFLQKYVKDLSPKNQEQQLDNSLTLSSKQDHLPGQTYLYFGCRNYNDFLYQDQLKEWVNQGVITELNVAFSQVSEEKVYVQDLIEAQGQKLWEIISNPHCYYYVCGDAKMADEVNDLLMLIVKKYGGLSHIEAVNLFEKMKKENRFLTDVWGVTLNYNYKEAIKQLQKDNYNRAEKWLEKLRETEQFTL